MSVVWILTSLEIVCKVRDEFSKNPQVESENGSGYPKCVVISQCFKWTQQVTCLQKQRESRGLSYLR